MSCCIQETVLLTDHYGITDNDTVENRPMHVVVGTARTCDPGYVSYLSRVEIGWRRPVVRAIRHWYKVDTWKWSRRCDKLIAGDASLVTRSALSLSPNPRRYLNDNGLTTLPEDLFHGFGGVVEL